MHDDIRDLRKEVSHIDKVLAINTASLEEHHKRTTIAEERLIIVEDYIKKQVLYIKIFTGIAAGAIGLIKLVTSMDSILPFILRIFKH
jgi:hypothetical protein